MHHPERQQEELVAHGTFSTILEIIALPQLSLAVLLINKEFFLGNYVKGYTNEKRFNFVAYCAKYNMHSK